MNSATAPAGPKRPKFSTARRGFEKDEVEAYLDEMRAMHDKLASSAALAERRLTDATSRFGEMENQIATSNERVAALESELEAAREAAATAPAPDGNDENMQSMVAAKERIVDRANERARKIEEEAQATAREIVAKAQEQAARVVAVQDDPSDEPKQEDSRDASIAHESVALARKEAAVILARA